MLIPDKVLHNETQRHIARMGTLTDALVEDLDVFIRGLHDKGLWGKLSVLCVVCPTEADSLLNLIGGVDSVKIGTPPFVADRGFTTSGTAHVINTQFSYDTSYSLNASVSVYVRGAPAVTDSYLIGMKAASSHIAGLQAVAATGDVKGYIQTNVATTLTMTGGGFAMASREDFSTGWYIADEIVYSLLLGAGTFAAPQYPVHVGCLNNEGTLSNASTNQYAHWSVGRAMDATDLLAYNILINAYMTGRGAKV